MSAHPLALLFDNDREWRGQHALAAFDILEEREQRLNCLNTGVLTVAVDDLARKRFGDACFGRDRLPETRAGFPELALQVVDDGFHVHIVVPDLGQCKSQAWDRGFAIMKPAMTTTQILRANVQALMEQRGLTIKGVVKISQALGGSLTNGTVGRIVQKDYTGVVRMNWLDELAKVFEIEPWQLLMPDLQPTLARETENLKRLVSDVNRSIEALQGSLRAEGSSHPMPLDMLSTRKDDA